MGDDGNTMLVSCRQWNSPAEIVSNVSSSGDLSPKLGGFIMIYSITRRCAIFLVSELDLSTKGFEGAEMAKGRFNMVKKPALQLVDYT